MKYMMNSAIGMDKKTVGYCLSTFDPRKNGLQSTHDLSMKLKYELVLGAPNNNFHYISIRTTTKRNLSIYVLHEIDPLRNPSGNSENITVADFRHIQIRFQRKVDPMLSKRDIDFFSSCLATPKHQRPRTHERTIGIHKIWMTRKRLRT